MSYKTYLQHNETLDDLCERLKNKSQLIALINDLLVFELTELSNYDYFKQSKFESPKEQAIEWLYSSPFYIRKTGVSVFNKLFKQSIENDDWNLLKTLLGVTNANKQGVSQRLLTGPFKKNIPEINELEIYLTLLNLQKEYKTIANIENYWKLKFSLKENPHLTIILVNVFIKSSPRKSLQYFKDLEKFQKNPPMRKIRLIYLANLKVCLLNLIDLYNNKEKEIEKETQFFIEWSYSINSLWLIDLIKDVLSLRRLKDIRERILSHDRRFLEDIMVPNDLPLKLVEDYEIKMDLLPHHLEQFTKGTNSN